MNLEYSVATKKITNEVLEAKLDFIKENIESHANEEMRQFKSMWDILEKVDNRIDNIDITLMKQNIVLDDHIRRTEILENEIKPIKTHIDMFKLILKIAGVLLATGAGGFGIKELFAIFAE